MSRCKINALSSRICEHGTKSCVTNHTQDELDQLQARNRALVEALEYMLGLSGMEGAVDAIEGVELAKQALSNPTTAIYKAEQEVIEAVMDESEQEFSAYYKKIYQAKSNLQQAKERGNE